MGCVESSDKVTRTPVVPGEPDAANSQRFPMPKGWHVVCKLSKSDSRARWGSRPRPAAPSAAKVPAGSMGIDAELVTAELNKPLKLPVRLLSQWVEPKIGAEFLNRYDVRKVLPVRPGSRGLAAFEVFDTHEQTERALQICPMSGEHDIRVLVQRLQIETLDSENRLFVRLCDMAMSFPGRIAVVEDMPRSTLWQEFADEEPGPKIIAKVAAVANATLAGLCRLHASGWAHCGVSPHTVIHALDGCWKLTSLETARRVPDLAAAPDMPSGTTMPPEALLGLPVSERVDVWQLAATLCEAITRSRADGRSGPPGEMSDGSARGNAASQLCALIDLVGPLQPALLERSPQREELCTPEGHLLRSSTLDPESFEAIEISDVAKRHPKRVAETLEGVEGAGDVLEFLGRLLAADPEQRPSATEAMAQHFLRFAHTKCHAFQDSAEVVGTCSEGAVANKDTQKKSVGFGAKVSDDKEDAGEKHEAGESKLARKGTGFVQLGELPPSDDEDDEEEEGAKKVNFGSAEDEEEKEDKAGKGGTLARKGTGFVQLGELPPSDDEDEDEEEEGAKKVNFGSAEDEEKEDKAEKGGTLARKGTGFVQLGELPPSDDEDEDEEEEGAKKVNFGSAEDEEEKEDKAGTGGTLARKGTGFVQLGELPPSDDEDEDEEEHHVKIQDDRPDKKHDAEAGESKLARKGTGFVQLGELPPSDDEDDEDEEEEGAKKVNFGSAEDEEEKKEDKGGKGGTLARKGTGFVQLGELPPSDDEDEDEEEHHVKIQDDRPDKKHDAEAGGSKLARKGTGFVQLGELPDDDEDEDEDEDEDKKHVKIDAGVEDKSEDKGKQTVPARKGTGFVNVGDLPDDDDDEDDEEEEEARGVKFSVGASEEKKDEAPRGPPVRKGTGFVSAGELPDDDDEDDDED